MRTQSSRNWWDKLLPFAGFLDHQPYHNLLKDLTGSHHLTCQAGGRGLSFQKWLPQRLRFAIRKPGDLMVCSAEGLRLRAGEITHMHPRPFGGQQRPLEQRKLPHTVHCTCCLCNLHKTVDYLIWGYSHMIATQ